MGGVNVIAHPAGKDYTEGVELFTTQKECDGPVPRWSELTLTFLNLGTTCWGGIWASLTRVEKILCDQRGWVSREDLLHLLALATLVPGPTFVALGGLIGYRLRGIWGAAICAAALVLPSALMVMGLMWLLPVAWAEAGMGMVGRAVGIAVGGILLGTAVRSATGANEPARGLPLAAAAAVLLILGLSTLAVLVGGLIVGRFLLSEPKGAPEKTP